MKKTAANILVLMMSVTYFLLAVQAEIVTAVFGYVFGSLLALALLASLINKGKNDA